MEDYWGVAETKSDICVSKHEITPKLMPMIFILSSKLYQTLHKKSI